MIKRRLVALLLPLLGCGGGDASRPPAEEFDYVLRWPGPEAPLHGVLMLGDRELGRSSPGGGTGGSQWDREYGTVHARLPRATVVADHEQDFAIQVTTGCETSRVPLRITPGAKVLPRQQRGTWTWSRAYELERRAAIERLRPDTRHTSSIEVPIDWADAAPASLTAPRFTLYVDRHQADGAPPPEVMIGNLTIPDGETSLVTDGLACADAFDIKVNGVVVGQLARTERARAFLISTEPACYRMGSVRYASLDARPMPTSPPMHLARGVVWPLNVDHIDHFLREAPSSERSPTVVSELLREDCPPP